MKKFFSLLLCAVLLSVSVTGAFAQDFGSVHYNINTDSTTTFQAASSVVTSTGDHWWISITSGTVSDTHRAVIRVHSGYNAASSLWVYSSNNTTLRAYKTAYLGGGFDVQLRGRLDNRDSGTLNIGGYFHY